MKANIYYLKNPITGEAFYVGATTKPLSERLVNHYRHLKEFEKGLRKSNRRYRYLLNLFPWKASIELLEVVNFAEMEEKEKYYIELFRKLNPLLTNMTDGGRGQHTSKYYTEEEMEEYSSKISNSNKGKSKPEGFAENLSVSRKGLGNPAAKEIVIGWLVAFKHNKAIKLFKYGFEVNVFIGSKHAASNVLRQFTKGLPYGYNWVLFKNCSQEVQDIVQKDYENSF